MQHGGKGNNNNSGGIGGSSRRVAAADTAVTDDPSVEYYDTAWPMTHPDIFGQHHQPHTSHLAQWVQDRQKAFHDFQSNSLIQPPTSLFSRDFSRDWTPPPPPSRVVPPPLSLLTTTTQPRDSERQHPNLELTYNSSYPKNRNHNNMLTNAEPLNPKAKVSYDEGQFTVEIPLHEYTPEELSVKTEGDVLVILAKHETQTETGSSFISKQFEQRFSLPSGVKPDAIVSSLSKDGVLSVTAPRSAPALTTTATNAPISGFKKTRGNAIDDDVFNPQTTQGTHMRDGSAKGLPHPKVSYDDDKFQISLDCKHYKPEELDVKVDGHTIIITATQQVKENAGTRTRVFEQKFTLPSGVLSDRVTSTITADGVLTINAPKGKAQAPASSMNQQTIEQKMDRILSPASWSSSANQLPISSQLSANQLPLSSVTTEPMKISRDFDTKMSRNFPTAATVVDDFDTTPTKTYMENDTYKIEMDVQNFKPEELVIKTVGNTVQVEAKHEEKTSDGSSFSSRNFSQSYTLPSGIDPDSVCSSLSKDGKLTIEAPLPKVTRMASNERLVPIKHK